MNREKILIVGGVAGGATAAARARRMSAEAEIVMLEAGPDVSFANCGLPYYIGGDIKSRSKLILQSPESFKDQYNVDVFVNTRATEIDRKAHVVKTVNAQSGEKLEFSYTKLILAQGGKPIVPPLPGADSDHVFSLWTLEDMDKIDSFISDRSPKSAVIVGGGFIGLEMAEGLAKRGLKVEVVEMLPHVMSMMEAEISGFLQEELLAYGVGVHTSRAVTRIHEDTVVLDDEQRLGADMVLLSVGVRPTLDLAKEAGLDIGEAGGLLVNEYLQTNDPDIFAAGDMVELEHRVSGQKVRIPLAGPANRQGRIAASNALGMKMPYRGSQGTSVVRVFDAVAGSTGLSLKQARALGLSADSVTVHKEHHTSYYPGSEPVSVMLVYNRENGVILGGQTAGYKGADKRLDSIATATAAGLTLADLAETDFAYSPPIGTANDALNMAAFTAENRMSGYSPAISVSEMDDFVHQHNPVFVDVRDVFAFNKSHVEGALHVPHTHVQQHLQDIPRERVILLYDETGKKGHQVLRALVQAGYSSVYNISGGFSSMYRFGRVMGFDSFELPLPEVESKDLQEHMNGNSTASSKPDSSSAESEKPRAESNTDEDTQSETSQPAVADGPLIVDVRTPEEFAGGAVPDALNIPLDELQARMEELGGTDRELILYCASGARSAYGVRVLQHFGYTNVQNGGGVMDMMSRMS